MSETIKQAYATLQAETAAADKAARSALVAFSKDFETKDCGRCGGRGLVSLGSDRAPGDCFRCGTAGKVLARKADIAALRAFEAATEVVRLRTIYRATLDALRVIEPADTAADRPVWSRGQHTKDLRARLARLEAAGKAAVAAAGKAAVARKRAA